MTDELKYAIERGDIAEIRERLSEGDPIPEQYRVTNLSDILTKKNSTTRKILNPLSSNGTLDSELALEVAEVISIAKRFDQAVYNTVEKHSQKRPPSIHSASSKKESSNNKTTVRKSGLPSFLLNNISNSHMFDFSARFSALFAHEKENNYSQDKGWNETGWTLSKTLLDEYIEVAQQHLDISSKSERTPSFVQFKDSIVEVSSIGSSEDGIPFNENNEALLQRIAERKKDMIYKKQEM